MVCSKCQLPSPEGAKFCNNCGSCLNCHNRSFLSRHKWWFILGSLFFIFIVLPFFFFTLLIAGIGAGLSSNGQTKTLISGSLNNKIAVININGEIVEQSSSGGLISSGGDVTSSKGIRATLDQIDRDKDVKGILLNVNSPGGSAAASEEIYNQLVNFKKSHNLKIVAYFSDLAASGGYYVSQSADKIVANPSNITGSIGVIISYLNYGNLASKYGVDEIVYKSGPYKDIVSSFKEPSDQEKIIMQSVVNDAYDNFVKTVSAGRNMPESQVRSLADGRIYSAKQAEGANLVDGLGNFEDGVKMVENLSGVKNASVVEYGQPSFLDSLLGSVSSHFNLTLLPNLNQEFNFSPGIKVMYMYTD